MMTTAADLPIGARRNAVARVERDIELCNATIDLALDTHLFEVLPEASAALTRLRIEHARLISCHIHEIEGATEWYREQDLARRLEAES